MTTSAQLWSELQSTFLKDLPATVQLNQILDQERSALESRDYDNFQSLLTTKKALINQLKQHADSRMHALQAAGFDDEATTLAAAEIAAPVIARSWQQLAQQWQQCQHLNAVNERILQRTQLVVSQTLDILRGANSSNRLYDTKGITNNSATGRTITSA